MVFEGGWRGENKKSELKAVNVIQDIRDEFHIVGGEAAVAGGEAAVADDDPMLGLDDVVETQAAPTAKASNRNKDTKRSDVRELTMPMRPLCAAPEANSTRIITVYRKAAASEAAIRNNTALYLRTDCLDWLLSYAADELYFQGVVPTIEIAPQSRTGNCPEVNDLYLEWDFSARSWDATFVAGTFANTTKSLSLKDLDKDRWSKLKMESPTIGDLSTATRLHMKTVAKLFITNWCKAIAGNECAEFEKEWGLGGTNLETPPKKHRRRDEPAGEEKPAGADLIENESAVADLSGADED